MSVRKLKGLGGMFRDALQGAVQRKYDHYPEKKVPEKEVPEKKAHGLAMRVRSSLEEAMSSDPVHIFKEHMQREIDLYAGAVKECPLTRIDAEETVAGNPFDEMRQQVVNVMHQKYREPDQQVHYGRAPWWKRLFKL